MTLIPLHRRLTIVATALALAALVGALVVGALVVGASPAAAHAELRATEPAAGSQLDDAPEEIALSFSEGVEASLGALRVFDETGERVDIGSVERRDGGAVVAADLPALDDGGYVVSWAVVSADGHPIRGTYTFRVGEAAADDAGLASVVARLAAEGSDRSVDITYAAARALAFAAVLLVIGTMVFAAWLCGDRHRAAAHRLAFMAVPVAVAATVALVALQGADLTGGSLPDALDPGTFGDVARTRFGRVLAGRIAVLAILALLVRLAPRARWTATALVVALAATPGLSGHASTGRWVPVALVADTVHVLAAGVWLGGLVAIVVVARLGRVGHEGHPPGGEETALVDRFSGIALAAVSTLVASGLVQSVRQVGSLGALTGTAYGQLLLIKVGVFTTMVGAAWLTRRALRARSSALGRSVLVELALGAVVIAVTALLVNLEPARSALDRPRTTTIETAEGLVVDVTIDPARAGLVDVHVYTFSAQGAVRDVEEIRLTLGLDSKGIEALEVDLERAGAGHFSAYGVDVPIAGTWTVTVAARLTDVDQATGSADIAVRSG